MNPTTAAIDLAFCDGGIDDFESLTDDQLDAIALDEHALLECSHSELRDALIALRNAMPILRIID